MRLLPVLVVFAAMLLLIAVPAGAAPARTSATAKLSTKTTVTDKPGGVKHYHFVYGPVRISPGQNSIFFEPNKIRPPENGFITSFHPNLIYNDGTIPRVDIVHLHHAVWLINGYPTWAAGEEKTASVMPPGYGYPYRTTDVWQMNHMIHNLTPDATTVYITYDMDFVPATAPKAAAIIPVRTQWLDVVGGGYPVYNAIKGTGHGPTNARKYTYPDDSPTAPRNVWTVTKKETLVATWGHMHPGGLYDDLKITRNGVTKRLFRARAKYWEPAGAVSWDVSISVPKPSWKINVQPGDRISISGTYDTSRASWYESMAIMPTAVADGWHGVDPFTTAYPTEGVLTHGPLAENRNHGGSAVGLPDPVDLLNGTPMNGKQIAIRNFFYGAGDISQSGPKGRPPVVRPGQSITFKNYDSPPGFLEAADGEDQPVYHTITSCKTPCNRSTGVAYPLADGKATFDSGELGYGPAAYTAAANRDTWQTPKNLKPGTYSYFCRIHPFMRGAFRVVKLKGS